ncbi:MAG TPA: 4Fe-4S dicluster domain-containing protein [bacterium]|nr:4Fe-4S dicluster domain-containing protein [bacterium]
MARRKIIRIDEKKCNGCGKCINACSEGALKLINGKATLVREEFCDGFGDCLGECPTGALTIEERDAEAFDLAATAHHVSATRGDDGVEKLMASARQHGLAGGGCPGSRMITRPERTAPPVNSTGHGLPGQAIPSELTQWPVQLHLVNPAAPYFNGRELVVLSTCGPVASADIHWRFLRGRSVVVACPKLDRTEPYAGKLTEILANPSIPKVIVVRMSVPCCGGLTMMVREAASATRRDDLIVEEVVVGVDGSIQEPRGVSNPAAHVNLHR